jgi:hypothetical protein
METSPFFRSEELCELLCAILGQHHRLPHVRSTLKRKPYLVASGHFYLQDTHPDEVRMGTINILRQVFK